MEVYTKFEEKLDIFVIDVSAITCEKLVKKYISMKWLLKREYHRYTALIRTTTNTIRVVKDLTNKIQDFLSLIPPYSEVSADLEFDVFTWINTE